MDGRQRRFCLFYFFFLFLIELEWKLSEIGAVKTELEENPWKRREIADVMKMTVRGNYRDPDDSDDDDGD